MHRLRDGNPVDPRLQVGEIHARVDVRGEAGIAVAQDALRNDESAGAALGGFTLRQEARP